MGHTRVGAWQHTPEVPLRSWFFPTPCVFEACMLTTLEAAKTRSRMFLFLALLHFFLQPAPDQQFSKEQREQDLALCHLIWELSAPRGRSGTPMPVCLVVELDVVRKRVCICPHFSYWQAGDRNHFLLNDLIDWWPPEELRPLTVVCKPTRGTVAVLNDTDDDSNDEDVT